MLFVQREMHSARSGGRLFRRNLWDDIELPPLGHCQVFPGSANYARLLDHVKWTVVAGVVVMSQLHVNGQVDDKTPGSRAHVLKR